MPAPRSLLAPRLRRMTAHAIVAIVALMPFSPCADAQILDSKPWITNGPVYAVVRHGDWIYIGGDFGYVGPHTGSGVPIDATSGALPPSFPKVAGTILAAAGDGAGGWFIGGSFSMVGGVPRANLAHISADLSVSPWNPDANGVVRTILVRASTVYVGGDFTIVNGYNGFVRLRIAALDAATGVARAWDPSANNSVRALAMKGSTLYAGGTFSRMKGEVRTGIAAIDTANSVPLAWNPGITGGAVDALAVDDSLVYVGGFFYEAGGQARSNLAALHRVTGQVTAWTPHPNHAVSALALHETTLYAGGAFDRMKQVDRRGIAAFSTSSGELTPWNPGSYGEVAALAIEGSTLYAAGVFVTMGGQVRHRLASFDLSNGSLRAWSPTASNGVRALAVSGGRVYAGGEFHTAGGVIRSGLAALDATTGAATPWDPAPNYTVFSMAARDSVIYVGGEFLDVGGAPRRGIAALDPTTGLATSWNPGTGYCNPLPTGCYPLFPRVLAIALAGNTVYVAGTFSGAGGHDRNHIAALDATSGQATPWNPNANDGVYALAVTDSVVYAGGTFTHIGGMARNRIAALDPTTGAASAWDPGAGARVTTLLAGNASLYVGGEFTTIGGQARNFLAELDPSTGLATAWNPSVAYGAHSWVETLARSGNTLYVGGNFTQIGGANRHWLAAVDATNGVISPWDPDPRLDVSNSWPSQVLDLAIHGSTLYVGGDFTRIGGMPSMHLAAYEEDVVTSTLVSLASANATSQRVRLVWRPVPAVDRVVVQRSTDGSSWTELGEAVATAAGDLEFEDGAVSAGSRYGYRLEFVWRGVEIVAGESWVDVPRQADFALEGARPNPASAGLRASFSLPDGSPARLELYDVTGRRVRGRDVGAFGPGRHTIDLSEGGVLAPGVYLLRLSRERDARSARVLVVR